MLIFVVAADAILATSLIVISFVICHFYGLILLFLRFFIVMKTTFHDETLIYTIFALTA